MGLLPALTRLSFSRLLLLLRQTSSCCIVSAFVSCFYISVKGESFRTRPARPWGPSSPLHSGYWVIPGGKAAGTWRWPPTPSRVQIKERVELYLYSPLGPSWPVLGWTLPLYSRINRVIFTVNSDSRHFLEWWEKARLCLSLLYQKCV